jgi:hypothetical protein
LIPTLNEEKGIGFTIDEIPIKEVEKAGYKVEVLVVDGGSNDKTIKIAQSKGARVIVSKKGYGIQYKTGFKNASGDIIIAADADDSYPLKSIPFFLEILNSKRLDFISVNRFCNMKSETIPIMRKIGNIFLTFVVNLLFGCRLRDSQSGMWIFKRKILDKLTLISNGMPLSEEIKIEAFQKVKSIEVDGLYKKRIGKAKSRILTDGWDNLIFLLKKRMFGD